MHPVAAGGFDRSAADYDRLRPTYPPDALDWIADALLSGEAGAVETGAILADVGAGTGILTRLLVPYADHVDSRVVAVEPLAGMRAVLHESMPDVPVVGGVGEALPFAAASFARAHRRAGVPLVRRATRLRGVRARVATGWARRVGVEHA